MKYLLLLFVPLFTHIACAQETDTRKVSDFSKIEAGGSFDVIVEQGNENVVTIESRGIDPEKIITEVKGDVLKVFLEKGNYNNVNATVYITYENLEALSGSGSGNLISKSDLSVPTFKLSNSGSGELRSEGNIKADQLSIDMSGSGDVEVASLESEDLDVSMSGSANLEVDAGSTNSISIHKSGSGDVKAYGLKTDVCAVNMSGSGTVAISAEKSIEGNISGSGKINYRGAAVINKFKSSGSGEITRN